MNKKQCKIVLKILKSFRFGRVPRFEDAAKPRENVNFGAQTVYFEVLLGSKASGLALGRGAGNPKAGLRGVEGASFGPGSHARISTKLPLGFRAWKQLSHLEPGPVAKRALRLRLRGYEDGFLGFLRFHEGRPRSLVAPREGVPADFSIRRFLNIPFYM